MVTALSLKASVSKAFAPATTLPPLELLGRLKSLRMSLDEGTQRDISNRRGDIRCADVVEALEYDSRAQRWRLPGVATPRVQLARNTQLSGSNTRLPSPDPPRPKSSSREKVEQIGADIRQL